MSASETLAAARDLLYEEGWSQNAHRGPYGPRCSFWAIIDAESVPRDLSGPSAFAVFKGVIGTEDVLAWNDAEGRTFGEVIDAFDRAELRAKELEAGT